MTQKFYSLTEAGQFFPKPLSYRAVYHRIRYGVMGIKLKCQFDGKQIFTTEQWVREFIHEVTEKRKWRVSFIGPPVDEQAEYERKLAIFRSMKNGGIKRTQ